MEAKKPDSEVAKLFRAATEAHKNYAVACMNGNGLKNLFQEKSLKNFRSWYRQTFTRIKTGSSRKWFANARCFQN